MKNPEYLAACGAVTAPPRIRSALKRLFNRLFKRA